MVAVTEPPLLMAPSFTVVRALYINGILEERLRYRTKQNLLISIPEYIFNLCQQRAMCDHERGASRYKIRLCSITGT